MIHPLLLSHSSRLPEGDFGKMMAKEGNNYPPSYHHNNININYDGMMVMLKAIFGEESVPEVCFKLNVRSK